MRHGRRPRIAGERLFPGGATTGYEDPGVTKTGSSQLDLPTGFRLPGRRPGSVRLCGDWVFGSRNNLSVKSKGGDMPDIKSLLGLSRPSEKLTREETAALDTVATSRPSTPSKPERVKVSEAQFRFHWSAPCLACGRKQADRVFRKSASASPVVEAAGLISPWLQKAFPRKRWEGGRNEQSRTPPTLSCSPAQRGAAGGRRGLLAISVTKNGGPADNRGGDRHRGSGPPGSARAGPSLKNRLKPGFGSDNIHYVN